MKEQELNTLKKKSPSDLWKEDLAVFIEELEVCVYKIYIIVEAILFKSAINMIIRAFHLLGFTVLFSPVCYCCSNNKRIPTVAC